MYIKAQIIQDIEGINNLQLLNQLYEYVQVIKKTSVTIKPNKSSVLKFVGMIDNEEAKEMKDAINHEFNRIEGEW